MSEMKEESKKNEEKMKIEEEEEKDQKEQIKKEEREKKADKTKNVKKEEEGGKEEEEEEEEEDEDITEKDDEKKGKNIQKEENEENEIYNTEIKNIEVINNTVTCYIGEEKDKIKSSKIFNDIKSNNKNPNRNVKIICDLDLKSKYYPNKADTNKFIEFYHPIFKKKIKIYNVKGKEFKADIYFVEDIKNIVAYFKMKKPHYLDKSSNNYIKLEPDQYSSFLLGNNDTIKDISYSPIKYEKLKKIYKRKMKTFTKIKGRVKKHAVYLKEINLNLDNYSENSKLKYEEIFYTRERNYFTIKLNEYYFSKENCKILGIYGNYSSGKTISLIIHNYYASYPTLYLNLKALKNAFQTNGYTVILPNEIINICIKANYSFENYQKIIKEIYLNCYTNFSSYIISIINYFSQWEALIF